jgi:hypothetical protein
MLSDEEPDGADNDTDQARFLDNDDDKFDRVDNILLDFGNDET